MGLSLLLWLIASAIVALPLLFEPTLTRGDVLRRAAILVPLGVSLTATQAELAFAGSALTLSLHAIACRSRTGGLALWLAAASVAVAIGAASVGAPSLVFGASLVAIALRLGVIPAHLGVAALAERHPAMLVELAGTSVVAVFVHLRFAIPGAETVAHDAATWIVAWGAVAALLGAVLALVQPTLRGLWSTSFTMHAGMLLAAVGTAGRGHPVAAVFVAVSMALALGGFGATVLALEARSGQVDLRAGGGRARSFPLLSATFAFFAAAGIALPGTAGFIADDLLLHALWEEAPVACGLVLTSSATLAIALLRGFSAAFLGPLAQRSLAPDLRFADRIAFAGGAVALIGIGVAPMLVITRILEAFHA